jgi:hypothetical protein
MKIRSAVAQIEPLAAHNACFPEDRGAPMAAMEQSARSEPNQEIRRDSPNRLGML